MEIHFCDLCNESVPQSDLDGGHAFIRRGRVVCARCERAMTHGSGSGSHEHPGAGGSTDPKGTAVGTQVQATVESRTEGDQERVVKAQSLLAGAPPEPWSPPGAASFPTTSPAVAGAAPPAGRSSGLVLAMVALLFAAGAVAVLNEQVGDLKDRARALEARHRSDEAARQELARAEAGTRDALARLETRFAEGLERERQTSEKSFADLRAEAEGLRRAGTEFGQKVEEMRAAVVLRSQEADRRADEISHRIAKSEDDGRAIAERLAKVEEQAQRPVVPAAAPEVPAESRWGAFVADLQSPKAATRWEAVDQLGQVGDSEAVPHLLPMLKDADVFVRMATARVLGDLKATTAVPALIDALEDGEPAVREAALGSLRTLTGKDLRFDPMAGDSDRAKKVKAWREWWKKTEEEGGLGKGQVPGGA